MSIQFGSMSAGKYSTSPAGANALMPGSLFVVRGSRFVVGVSGFGFRVSGFELPNQQSTMSNALSAFQHVPSSAFPVYLRGFAFICG